MATIPIGCFRVQLQWTPDSAYWPGEKALNTFAMRAIDFEPPTGPALHSLLVELSGKVKDALDPQWSSLSTSFASGYQITAMRVSALDTSAHTSDEYVLGITGGHWAGTGTSGVLPPEVALCLSLYGYQPGTFATQRGRKRGRIYLPYLSAATVNTHGLVDSGSITSLTGAFKSFFDLLSPVDVTGGQMEPGILSEVGGIFTSLAYLGMDNHFDAQRRRQHQSPATTTVVSL